MEKEKILEFMRELKVNAQKRGRSIEPAYLGKIKIDENIKDIYLVRELIEKKINGEMQTVEVDSYITEQLEKIAGNNKSDSYPYPIVVSKYTDQKQDLEEQLQTLEDEGLIDLGDLERERAKEIAKALNIEEKQIKEIQEIDLNQEIQEPMQQGQQQVTQKDLKGLDIKEETNLNQYIKGETLEKKLGLRENGIEDGVKLARVSSSSLNKYLDKPTTQIDSFVVIRKDGTAVALGENILTPDNSLGTNPTKKIATANVEMGDVEEEPITTSWKIANRKNDYLTVGYDESYGSHREMKYTMRSVEEKEYVSVELETQYTYRQDEDIRQYMKERGEGTRTADNAIKRDGDQTKGKREQVQDIDNDKNNDTELTMKQAGIDPEQKIPDTDITWREFADKCNITVEDAYDRFQEKREKENVDIENEDIINEIEDDVNEEWGMPEQKR